MSYIAQSFLDGLMPEARLTVSQWADNKRELDEAAAAEAGQYRTSRTPYLREIQDNLSARSPITHVTVMKGAQLGFTEAGLNWLGYVADIAPGPFMLIMPTDKTLKKTVNTRIEPMIKANPTLQRKFMAGVSKRKGNSTLEKHFLGGAFYGASARSTSDLSSTPVRYIMMDEIDRYKENISGEGDPIAIAEARTDTYSNRKKIYQLSTPTVEDASNIEKAYKETDQNKYFVPCPHCNYIQELIFEGLSFEPGKPDTVVYVCQSCGFNIEERHKTTMLANGEWRATAPENTHPFRKGYHINSLYSPLGWLSWVTIVERWLKAQDDPEKLRAFYNTTLGLPYKEKTERPAWKILWERRSGYARNTIPSNDVVFITAGVDVQADRFEVEIVGWCRDKKSYSIDYRVLPADTTRRENYKVLDNIVAETWVRPDGLVVPMRTMVIDSSYNTAAVYEFCRDYQYELTRVVPIRGKDRQQTILIAPTLVDTSKYGGKMGGLKFWKVGVSILKERIYGHLNLQVDTETGVIPHGWCEFPAQYDEIYFQGLTAEAYRPVILGGQVVKVWEKKFKRNEPLDCRVYAWAAAVIHGYDNFTPQNFTEIESSYRQAPPPPEIKKDDNGYWRNTEEWFT